MSVIGFQTQQELAVPPDAFNVDGLAELIATGGRYGGQWLINVLHGEVVLGSVWTERTEDPDVAAETARAWIEQECERVGLKVAHYISRNDNYGPNERPYFTTAQVIVASKEWA